MAESKPQENRSTFWQSLSGCCALMFCFKLYLDNSIPKTPYKLPDTPAYKPLSIPSLHRDSLLPNPKRTPSLSIRQKTEQYWKVAVADLHELRFAPAAETGPPLRALRNFQTAFQAQQDRIKAMPSPGVDADLVKMVEKHLAMDQELLEVLSQFQQELRKAGFSEDFSPPQEQVERGLELLAELQSDPSLIDKMDPKERERAQVGLALAKSYDRLWECVAEQYHDIELMQARLQGRYPGGDFSLPELPEFEE